MHFCAICDGAPYKGKRVLVVGGGNSAFDEGLYLLNLGVAELTVVEIMDRFFAAEATQDALLGDPRVKGFKTTKVVDVEVTDGKLSAAILENAQTGERTALPVDGIFVFLGQSPNNEWFKDAIALDDKGYISPIKYARRENGIYISKDQTCSIGDYRTIARNRTINKSRRAVRAALLPYVNSPLMVNPSTGFLAPSKITAFKTLISDILAKMQAAQEISGYAVTIDANQNVLVNDTLKISYVIVPVGVAVKIYVEEGLSLTANS